MAQKGVVLFTTIIMLAILTLLTLSLMQAVFLYVKASNHLAKRHQAFYSLEAAANQLRLSNLLSIDRQCRVEVKNPNDVVKLLKHHHGCGKVFANQSYVYLIEDLGDYPCLQIESDSLLWSSHHWLLSIATKDEPFELLQLRIAEAVGLLPCEGMTKMVDNGILSWRHLI